VQFLQTALPGVIVVVPDVHRDARGFFLETFHADKYRAAGIDRPFVQDNHSRSVRGTVRGLHLQIRRPQAKLVRVIEGTVYDVAVDLRRGSPTFGKWVGVELSAENFKQSYVPAGFAHGFSVTSEIAQVEYKCTDRYDPEDEIGVAWDDPDLAIRWPATSSILSDRDRKLPRLADIQSRLPIYQPPNL
jgi:dTDP-4-dehydrorhamnose 3,5-epimerase